MHFAILFSGTHVAPQMSRAVLELVSRERPWSFMELC